MNGIKRNIPEFSAAPYPAATGGKTSVAGRSAEGCAARFPLRKEWNEYYRVPFRVPPSKMAEFCGFQKIGLSRLQTPGMNGIKRNIPEFSGRRFSARFLAQRWAAADTYFPRLHSDATPFSPCLKKGRFRHRKKPAATLQTAR